MSSRRDFIGAAVGLAATATAARVAPSKSLVTPGDGAGARGSDVPNDYAGRLESARAAADVTGASFAYWDGKAMHTAVAGVRNSVTLDPITADTVMHVGSITKITNTVLLMQLVDEGKVGLDDPISRYLPELRLRDVEALKRITCRMLVNHTSGINCEWLPDRGPDKERIVDAIARCADVGQLFPPGEMASYNNMAHTIAGYLTQEVRQDSWYTVVRKRIYEPLELHHSLVDPLDAPRFRTGIGDRLNPMTGTLTQASRPFLSVSFAPAGSTQMTSAVDIVTQARALLNGGRGPNGARILSAASAAQMVLATAEFVQMVTSPTKIGLGWMLLPDGVLYHGGGGPGIASHLYAHPASGRAMALLTNCDRRHALTAEVLDPVIASWTGVRRGKAVMERWDGAVDWKRYAGTYETNMQRVEVAPKDGDLELKMDMKIPVFDDSIERSMNGAAIRVSPIGRDAFGQTSGGGGMEIRFVQPSAGGQLRFLAMGNRLLARTS